MIDKLGKFEELKPRFLSKVQELITHERPINGCKKLSVAAELVGSDQLLSIPSVPPHLPHYNNKIKLYETQIEYQEEI